MTKYEYRTVELAFTGGMFKRDTPDIQATLNAEAENGWRLHQNVLQVYSGQPQKLILIFERERTR